MRIIFAFILTAFAAGQTAHYDKVVLDDPAALCLDGSPAAYYISKGEAPQKVLIVFEGGGWCGNRDLSSTTQSCYQRSKGALGSSASYPATLNISQGILSNNELNDFRKYTKVFLKYCTGAGHQGSRKEPISYKGTNLYFRGNNVTIAQLNSLEKNIGLFSKATDIIVSGDSAGGLAVFLWADYINSKASAQNVYAVPDSGIFLDSPNYQTKTNVYSLQFENLFKLSNTESGPPAPECLKKFSVQPHKCMFAANLFPYMATPIFAIQSLYDSWSIPNILGIRCISGQSLKGCKQQQLDYIEEYHRNTTETLFQMASNLKNGFWAPVCVNHVYSTSGLFYSESYRIPQKSPNSIDFTLLNWITGQTDFHRHLDSGIWPMNGPCSGLSVPQLDIVGE